MGDREACNECKQKCSFIHGNKTDLVTTFNKILFGAYDFSKHLFLPQKIYQAIPVLVAGENYSLQDTHGQRWEVKLGTKDDRLAFTDGWNKFYKDHGLREGYVLTFHYIMNSHFVVNIFDRTGFEKLMFPLADGRKRKRSEMDGNCNAVGECQNLSKNSTKKQDAAFTGTSNSGAKTHSQPMSKDKFSSLAIEKGNLNENPVSAKVVSGELLAEVTAASTLSNNITSNRATVTKVDPDGSSDRRNCPSNNLAESDVVAGNLNENPVSAKVASGELLAELAAASTLSNNITSKRAVVTEVDPDESSDRRNRPSNTLAESDAVAGNLNENPASAKVVSEELLAEVAAASTLSNNITSKRATVAEVDNGHHDDHPCVPPIEKRDQVHSEYRNKSSTASSKRVIEEAAGGRKHSRNYPKCNDRSGQIFGGDERNDEVRGVKTELVDSFNDNRRNASAILFKATVSSCDILELPKSVTLWACDEKKVVYLRGPDELLWPVLYQNRLGIKALTSGWKSFLIAWRVQIGDKCAFVLEDEAKAIFRVKNNKKAVKRS